MFNPNTPHQEDILSDNIRPFFFDEGGHIVTAVSSEEEVKEAVRIWMLGMGLELEGMQNTTRVPQLTVQLDGKDARAHVTGVGKGYEPHEIVVVLDLRVPGEETWDRDQIVGRLIVELHPDNTY